MKHAKGLGQLVQMRGPYRYRTELEISLLKTSRGLIVSTFYLYICFSASSNFFLSGHAVNVWRGALFLGE